MFIRKILFLFAVAVFLSSALIFPTSVKAEETIYIKSVGNSMALIGFSKTNKPMSGEITLKDNFSEVVTLSGIKGAVQFDNFKSTISFTLPENTEVNVVGGISTMTFPPMATMPRTYFYSYDNIKATRSIVVNNKLVSRAEFITVLFELRRTDKTASEIRVGEGTITILDKTGTLLSKEKIIASRRLPVRGSM
jgi:hypothetical protein